MIPVASLRSASYLGVLSILATVFAVHSSSVSAMAELWRRPTYSHGYAVVPLFAWLLWERRDALAALPVRPSWGGVAALASLGAVWLVADLAAAAAPAQFAVVAMVPAGVAALLGIAWLRAMAFPLAFLFFAVPFGEAWVPTLMTWTADFTVSALRASGVPVFREGTHFSIPSGNWAVVEACSGIAYMSACAMVSTLFAWTVYCSTTRRALFIAGALTTALVANWFRAYAIVMIAHYSDYRLAVGIDHFAYGFVFFGVVIAIVLAFGMMWREDRSRSEGAAEARPAAVSGATTLRQRPAAAVAAVAALLWPLAASSIAPSADAAASEPAVIAGHAGWTRIDARVTPWQPEILHPTWTTVQTFVKGGRRVSVYLAAFDRSTADSKLVSSAHRLVLADDPQWKLLETGDVRVPSGDEGVGLARGTLSGPSGRVVVWHGYWVDGLWTRSGARAIAAQLAVRWRAARAVSAWMAIAALDGDEADAAAPALESFVGDMRVAIDDALRESSRPKSPRPAP